MKLNALCSFVIFAVCSGLTASAAPVKFLIQNVTHTKGPIYISLFSTQHSWADETPTSIVKISPVEKGTAISVVDLAPGDYAFFVFHDLDDNGEVATTFLGFPAEPYAFSNNFKLKMSKPNFADLKFVVDEIGATHSVKLLEK